MSRILEIACYEYIRHVRRRSFLFVAFGLPLLIAGLMGVVVLVFIATSQEQRLGLVDQSGQFAAVAQGPLNVRQPVPIAVYADEDAARAALRADALDVYVVIPDDYVRTGSVRAVGEERLGEGAESTLRAVLRQGVLQSVAPDRRERLSDPSDLTLRTVDGGRSVSARNIALLLLPFAIGILFIVTAFTTSGYLLQAITEEKESRVIELMATTVRPEQMMAGKIIGLSGVGLTQMLSWLLLGAIAAGVALRNTGWLAGLQLPWGTLGLSLLYFVFGYLLLAGCYATVGAAVATPQEAQPFAAPISILAGLPYLLMTVITAQPNGMIATVLSLIPFSAPMTMLMRLPLADIPPWQIVASLAMVVLGAIGAIWLAARVMRIGMLRVGKRLSLREIVGAARVQPRAEGV
jgi:ABC-2 type transport system permease protein